MRHENRSLCMAEPFTYIDSLIGEANWNVSRWDRGMPVVSIQPDGAGPCGEQAIQIMLMEFVRSIVAHEPATHRRATEICDDVIRTCRREIGSVSVAQVKGAREAALALVLTGWEWFVNEDSRYRIRVVRARIDGPGGAA